MTNGDDSRSGDGQQQQAEEANLPQTTEGGEGESSGVSGIDEGWGEGGASIDEVVENVQAFFESFKGEMLIAWGAYAAVALLLQTVEVGLYTVSWLLGDVAGGLFSLLMLPVWLLVGLAYPLVTAGQMTLYGPMRAQIFEGVEPEGWQGAVKQGLGRFWPVLGAILAIGAVIPATCVLPGLVLAFFAVMAPYFLATRPSLGFVDAFKRSYEVAKRHWEVFAITIGALLASMLLFGCVFGVGVGLSWLPAPIGRIFADYATWLAATVFQLGIFVVWGGVFVTVDGKETGERVGAEAGE